MGVKAGCMVTGKVRVLVRRRHERKECVVVEEEVRVVERGFLCEGEVNMWCTTVVFKEEAIKEGFESGWMYRVQVNGLEWCMREQSPDGHRIRRKSGQCQMV